MLECRRQSGWNMKDIEFPLPSYPQTHVTFRWSKRAKRLHLRVSEVKRKAELIVPYSVTSASRRRLCGEECRVDLQQS